jgi:hypothetical protein
VQGSCKVQYKAANLGKRERESRICAGYPIRIAKRIIHPSKMCAAVQSAIFAPGRARKGPWGRRRSARLRGLSFVAQCRPRGKKTKRVYGVEAGWNSMHQCVAARCRHSSSSSRFSLFAQPARAVAAASVRNLYSSSTLMPCLWICLFLRIGTRWPSGCSSRSNCFESRRRCWELHARPRFPRFQQGTERMVGMTSSLFHGHVLLQPTSLSGGESSARLSFFF